MTFKTILAVTAPDLGNGDLKLAAALCEEIGAHLAVLAVALAAPPPIGEYAAVMSEAWQPASTRRGRSSFWEVLSAPACLTAISSRAVLRPSAWRARSWMLMHRAFDAARHCVKLL